MMHQGTCRVRKSVQVHDELILEGPEEHAEKARELDVGFRV